MKLLRFILVVIKHINNFGNFFFSLIIKLVIVIPLELYQVQLVKMISMAIVFARLVSLGDNVIRVLNSTLILGRLAVDVSLKINFLITYLYI